MHNTQMILEFLAELKENNQKEWMDANRKRYEQARDEFKSLVSDVLESMKQHDPSLEGLAVNDCIFRQNRDIRFSADKSPYKSWMSAVLAEGGKKTLNAVYYLHLQPGDETMVAAGKHQPAGAHLKMIRQEVDYNPKELIEVVSAPAFQKYFGEIQGEKLSRAPKGYAPDHPNIEFLKLKSFLAIRKFTDAEVLKENFADEVIETFKAAQPFKEYLDVAVS